MKKIKKIKKINLLSFFILILGFIILIYSSINIYKDSANTQKIIEKISTFSKVENNNKEISEETIDTSKKGIDLTQPKQINSDTVGWIEVNGTNVDYPFTQTTNNEYYLTHSFDKSYNSAGWVFLDYRNSISNFDKNTILYAHGRLDKTMFGSLVNVFESSWYNNSDNHLITLSTESKTTSWQIFSVYHIPATSDYIKTSFNSNDEFQSFVDMLKNRSYYNFDVTVKSSDNILTLSTCYNNNGSERLVVHAKLIS